MSMHLRGLAKLGPVLRPHWGDTQQSHPAAASRRRLSSGLIRRPKQPNLVYPELLPFCDYLFSAFCCAAYAVATNVEVQVKFMSGARAPSFDPDGRNCCEEFQDLPVDFDHLRRYTLGDKGLEAEVLELFLAQLPETIASLRTASTERDWKMAAHTLKGSSRAVGAWRIANLAQEAESLLCGSQPAACSEAISKLEAAVSEATWFVREAADRA